MESIVKAARQAASRYQRLVLYLDPDTGPRSRLFEALAEQQRWPVLNVSLALSEALLDLPARERGRLTASVLDDILRDRAADVVLLDAIELLFEPSLGQDPVKLLSASARHKTLVVGWPGRRSAGALSYARPGHPEYRSYKLTELNEIFIIEQGSSGRGHKDSP